MKKLITYTPYVKSYEVSTIKTIQKRTLRKNRKPFYADIKEKIDYMQTNLLNTQLLFSTKYRTLHLNKM